MTITHDELGLIAAKWLKRQGYQLSVANLWAAMINEKPDCLGFHIDGYTFLIEAKTSRSDFFADHKKHCRKNPDDAAGNFRAYITPEGLLKPEEIPYGWQLLEVSNCSKRKLTVAKGMQKVKKVNPYSSIGSKTTVREYINCDREEYLHFFNNQGSVRRGYDWLLCILRRVEASGVDIQKFAASNELWKK